MSPSVVSICSNIQVIFCTVKSRRMSPLWRQRRKVSAQTEVRVRANPPLWSRAGVIFSPDVNTVCECFRITKTLHTAAKLPQPFDICRHYRSRGPLPTRLRPGEEINAWGIRCDYRATRREERYREPAAVAGETVDSHNSDQFGLPEDVCDNCRSGTRDGCASIYTIELYMMVLLR